jgi:ABC-2 type transport system ATP-binding protein
MHPAARLRNILRSGDGAFHLHPLMLHLLHFCKAYPGQPPVLTVSDLHLPRGVHWFEGANGAGKTTFFRAIAGLIPTEGVLTLTPPNGDALDLHRDALAWRLAVNYGEAEPLYPPFLSAYALATYVAEAKAAPTGQVEKLADLLGATAFWHQPAGTYSSGMLKKTSLLLAFLGEPHVVVLDEPLITLDAAAQHVVAQLIAESVARGVTFLLSSHQPLVGVEVPLAGRWRVADGAILPLLTQ